MSFPSTHTWAPNEEITSDQLNDLDSKTVAAMDGVNGGTYAAPLNFSNIVGMIVNGLVTFNENVTLSTANFSVGSGSGIGILNGAFLTVANAGTISMQSGANQNVASGASINVASGGALSVSGTETVNSGGVINVASGGLLTVASGGNLSVTGTETIASGGTLVLASGAIASFAIGSNTTISGGFAFVASSVVSFASSPTFTNGFLVSSGPAQFNGFVNILGTATLVGGSNRLQLTARNVPRRICLANAIPGNALFNGGLTAPTPTYNPASDSITIAANTVIPNTVTQTVTVDLKPRHNSVLEDVEFVWTGSGNITMSVRRSGTAVAAFITSTPGTYVLSPNTNVDLSAHTYTATFQVSTAGTDSATLSSIKTTCDVSEYDEG